MFNCEARWDRHLPHGSYREESIDVGVFFKKGKLYPRWFIWRHRKYQIKEMTYRWEEKRGDEKLYFFAVSDGANVYQIYLNNKYMHWRLEKIFWMEG